MVSFFRKAYAFLKRDVLESASYKLSYFFGFVGIAGSLIFFFFLNKLIAPGTNEYLAPYGGNYFSYVIIGIAFSGYINFSTNIFGNLLEGEQEDGTLEALLLTPSRVYVLAFANSIWNFIFTSFTVILYLALGALFFGLDIALINIPSAVIVLVVSCVPFFFLGIIASSITLVTKQTSFIDLLTGRVTKFLAGVYFPIAVFPWWLTKAAKILPLTHSLEAMRKSVLMGAGLREIAPHLAYLLIMSLILAPISVVSYKFGFKKAKLYGNLVHH